jgi:hypothetical protein
VLIFSLVVTPLSNSGLGLPTLFVRWGPLGVLPPVVVF